jgi:hypothetical protein
MKERRRRDATLCIKNPDIRLSDRALDPVHRIFDSVAELPAALRHETDDLVDAAAVVGKARASGMNQLSDRIFVTHEALLLVVN